MKKFVNILSKITKNGFYIILFLCICAIGVSGYVMFSTPEPDDILAESIDDAEQVLFPEQDEFDLQLEQTLSPTPVEIPDKQTEDKPEEKPVPNKEKKEEKAQTAKVKKEETTPEKIVYVKPLDGDVSLAFSGEELIKSKTMGDWRVHAGVDIAAAEGTKVCAVAKGTVKDVLEDEMMGHTVVIEHATGCTSTYSNLMKGITVKKGDKVESGQVIGGVGTSAQSECLEAPHLHLELTVDNKNVDPMKYIK